MTALMKACYNEDIEIIEELIERGGDINAKDNQKRIRYKEWQH